MGTASHDDLDDDLRPEYDFSKMESLGRGKYAKQYREGPVRLIIDGKEVEPAHLEPDVRAAFPTDAAVNDALRGLMQAQADRSSSS